MSHAFSPRRPVLVWSVLLLILSLNSAWSAEDKPQHQVIQGKARFTVLAPDLIRMEYSPAGQFIDELSVAVVKREGQATAQSQSKDGWLELKTEKMTLRYKLDSGAFTEQTLAISWHDAQGSHAWKPGDKDEENLGGVVGDIAIRSKAVNDPGLLSRKGCYLLDDSATALRDAATQWVKPRPVQGGQDWYFFVYGRDFAGMLRRTAQLLGPVPMVPRYVLGAWFGSRANYADNQWKLIVDRYREEHLPLDMLVLDSLSWTNVVWSGYDFDYEQLPDPKGFIQWMLKRGVHTTFNEHFEPLTPKNDHNFETMRKAAGLPEGTQKVEHNIDNKQYAEAFMNVLHKPLLDMGMAFWWQDLWAGTKMAGLDPLLWTREVEYEGQERITGKRSFVFCRLGQWGSHRSGGFFTSDLIPQWNTLTMLVPFTQQGGNMLVPYVINLNSGVYGINVDPELYHRWTQFSAFSPVFWLHGLWGMRLPWEYGQEGMDTYRKFVGLRYALLPYTYTLARQAHEESLPLVRGMYLDYPDQEQAYQCRGQYMFGSELLVAPVTEPGHGKPVMKSVYLPAGQDWYDYFTGAIYRGGQTLAYECPLERMPLFVRAGAILPMAPPMDYSDQKPLDRLTLDVYASAKAAQYKLYEDDGVSLDYRKEKFAWTTFEFTPQGKDHTLTIHASQGSFEGQPASRRYELRIHGLVKPEAILLNGKAIEEKPEGEEGTRWAWDNKTCLTTVRLMEPTSVRKEARITIQGAGSFEDARMLQKVADYRERLRKVKQEEKLKYSMLLSGGEHGKPPRVIRETEAVETQLNELVASPRGLATNPPDFKALTSRVLKALTDQPFESKRRIPELNDSCASATKMIEHAIFEPAELRKMTATLVGLTLPSRTVWDSPPFAIVGPFLHVEAKLGYDEGSISPGKVSYELDCPDEDAENRAWVASAPKAREDGFTEFGVQHPNPTRFGKHTFKVRAILTWEGGQAELSRDADWYSAALP